MKTKDVTLLKEDVLALGQMVGRSLEELSCLLQKNNNANLDIIEKQEEHINNSCQNIEEVCLELLLKKETLSQHEIRSLLSCMVIGSKFERMADHTNRAARIISWAVEDNIDIPIEFVEMVNVIQHMVQDVLLSFLSDSAEKAREIVQQDNRVDYLHDCVSKRLLSSLGEGDKSEAQMKMQLLFCNRFLERMGDACTSIAKRVYFMVTGQRLKD